MTELRGVLCIGDPHLSPRTPGHRKDDYPRAIVAKLAWCLDYARREGLLPALLGDLFHVPRDNGNALVVELLGLLPPCTLAIVGNHDTHERALEPQDSLAVLVAAGRVRLVSREPWQGAIGGRAVAIGGTDWSEPLPERLDRAARGIAEGALVLWIAHHDVRFRPSPGSGKAQGAEGADVMGRSYEDSGRLDPREIPGVDVLVNGHIHRPLEAACAGGTTWLNPGNIARVTRSEASRRAPGALRIDVAADGWQASAVEVPHAPFEEVFYEEDTSTSTSTSTSTFVDSLAALTARRTSDGQNLVDFLEKNLERYPAEVTAEVRRLAEEVLHEQRAPVDRRAHPPSPGAREKEDAGRGRAHEPREAAR